MALEKLNCHSSHLHFTDESNYPIKLRCRFFFNGCKFKITGKLQATVSSNSVINLWSSSPPSYECFKAAASVQSALQIGVFVCSFLHASIVLWSLLLWRE